jgi:hypothetical protein
VDAKLVRAFDHPDPGQGLRNARHLATLLDKGYPGAAASLREGLEEMFTVARLGIDGRLATSNPIDSMISIARTTNRNVTHWKDGQMVLRWTAAGMINAERSFRRIKGYKQMPQLVAALYRHAHPDTAHFGTAVLRSMRPPHAGQLQPWSAALSMPVPQRIRVGQPRSSPTRRLPAREPGHPVAGRVGGQDLHTGQH